MSIIVLQGVTPKETDSHYVAAVTPDGDKCGIFATPGDFGFPTQGIVPKGSKAFGRKGQLVATTTEDAEWVRRE